MTAINTFQDAQRNHTPLSNFYHSPFYAPFFGRTDEIHLFPTVEHYFQSAKAKSRADALYVLSQPTPGAAKRAGRAVDMLYDWDDIKLDVMIIAIKKKFTYNNSLGLSGFLMETNPYELIEGNTWGDTFWGVCKGKGENNLGKILMGRRDQLFIREMAKSSYR